MTRCVGAFRRPCLRLTDRILCDPCWEAVESVNPPQRWRVARRPRLIRPGAVKPGAVRIPFRGDVS